MNVAIKWISLFFFALALTACQNAQNTPAPQLQQRISVKYTNQQSVTGLYVELLIPSTAVNFGSLSLDAYGNATFTIDAKYSGQVARVIIFEPGNSRKEIWNQEITLGQGISTVTIGSAEVEIPSGPEPTPNTPANDTQILSMPPTVAPSPIPVQPSPVPPQPSQEVPPTAVLEKRQMAFVSERNGSVPQVFIMNEDGSAPTQLTFLPNGACQPAWSPDGAKLLFVSPCNKLRVPNMPPSEFAKSVIFVGDYNANNRQLSATKPLIVYANGGAFEPDWSANGILFTCMDGNDLHICLVNANGQNLQRITSPNSTDMHPVWNPTGDKLLLRGYDHSDLIFWMDTAGGPRDPYTYQQISNFAGRDPDWGSNGNVLYVNMATEPPAIHVASWEIGKFSDRELYKGALYITTPRWDADSTQFAAALWLTNRGADTRYDIWLLLSTGAPLMQLTNDPASDYSPAWRP